MTLSARRPLFFALCLVAAGCEYRVVRQPPPPPPPPTAPPPSAPPTSTFHASGTMHNLPFSLDCSAFSPDNTAKDAAYYTNKPGLVFISCHNEGTGLAIAVTVLKLGAFTLNLGADPMATGGRLELTLKGETIATDAASVHGSITVRTWDTPRRRLAGSFSLSWDKDASGNAGQATGDFDVAGIHAAK